MSNSFLTRSCTRMGETEGFSHVNGHSDTAAICRGSNGDGEMDGSASFSAGIVDSLRHHLNISYQTCVDAAEVVLDNLVERLVAHSDVLDISALRELQRDVRRSQESMAPEEARGTRDNKNLTEMIEYLRDYRNSAGNHERAWPGGAYSQTTQDERKEDSSRRSLAFLRQAFDLVNPRILREVIEYPGQNHPDGFKLVEVIGEELQWLLQENEYSHTTSHLTSFQDIALILLRSISIHSQVGEVISSDQTIRSSLFRVLNKIAQYGTSDTSLSSTDGSSLLSSWMKLTTYTASFLTTDIHFQREFPDESGALEAFPEADQFFSVIIPKMRLAGNSVTTEFKEQLVGLIVSFVSLTTKGVDDFAAGYLEDCLRSARPDDEILEVLVYVTIRWWNHHGMGSILDGTEVSRDVGLHNAGILIPRFLAGIATVKFLELSDDMHFYDSREEHSGYSADDNFFLVRDSDLTLIREVCSRIISDCDETESIYQEAVSLEKHIDAVARWV